MNKIAIATKNEKLLTNLEADLSEIVMPDCHHPEADTRIVLHVLNCIENGVDEVYVRSNDTNVVVLLVGYMPNFLEINSSAKIVAQCGVGLKTYSLSINTLAEYVRKEGCKELSFLHSLSGCDSPRVFFMSGK